MSILESGNDDPFDTFAIHVEVFVDLINKVIIEHNGFPDKQWIKDCERVWMTFYEEGHEASKWTYDDFRRVRFANPGRYRQKGERSKGFNEATNLLVSFAVQREQLVASDPNSFRNKNFSFWPYYAAALTLVVDRARRTPGEVPILPDSDDGERDEALSRLPLVYVVPRPGGEGGSRDRETHQDGGTDLDGVAGQPHPPGRSAQRK